MDPKVKKFIWWSLGIFFIILVPSMIVLAANDIIPLGVSIGVLMVVFFVIVIIVGIFEYLRKRKGNMELTKDKTNEPITNQEAFELIKLELEKPEWGDYVLKKEDDWVVYSGGNTNRQPIYIVRMAVEYDNNAATIGFVNKVTREVFIRKYSKIHSTRKEIEEDITSLVSLFTPSYQEVKYRKTRKIADSGAEIEIVDPITEEKKEEEKEGVLK